MNLIQCFQKNSTWYKGAKANGKPIGVLWHDTGAGNPYIKRYVQPYETDANYNEMITLLGKNKYNNDWNHIEHEAGLNAWIGKLADESIATVQAGELTKHAWGCGGGNKGSCNGYVKNSSGTKWIDEFWIQFEICDDSYQDKVYFEKAYKEACEFTAYVCKQFGINPKGTVQFNGVTVPTILCHADSYKLGLGCNHGDVYGWFNKFGKTMDDVRNDVAALVSNSSAATQPTIPATTTSDIKKGDLVSIKSGATYYSGASIPQWVMNQNWYVEEVSSTSDRAVINKSENGKNAIMSPIKKGYLILVDAPPVEVPAETQPIEPEPTPVAREPYPGVASTGSANDEKTIWDFLLEKLGNEYAVAGVMGNLYAECSLRSNNLQGTYEKSLGMTDAEYTAAVDNGTYSKESFVNDHAGYGLAQWTYYTRKEKLYDYAEAQKKSIADLGMQLGFLWKEVSAAKWLNDLKNAKSVLEASNIILTKFEMPADQGETVQTKRAGYGERYYEKYHVAEAPAEPDDPVDNGTSDEKPQEQPVEAVSTETPAEGTYINTPEEAQNFLVRLLNHIIDFIMKLFNKK